MEKASVIGLILGIVALLVGMFSKGISPLVLLNPAAILIIVLGTVAAVCIAFPSNELTKIPKLFKIIFTGPTGSNSVEEIIPLFVQWSELARKEGMLALEEQLDDIEDEFLRNGLMLALDGSSSEEIRDTLFEEIGAMEDRHTSGASIFTQAGAYSPTLGILGAVLGLMAALGNMDSMDDIAYGIKSAFVATVYGIFLGYVFWHPFANKLKRLSRQEALTRVIIIEGIVGIQEGNASKKVKQTLLTYVPVDKRKKIIALMEEGGNKDG